MVEWLIRYYYYYYYGYYCTTSENKIHYIIQLLAPYNKVLWPGSASAPYTVNHTIYVVYIQWPLVLKRFIPYYSVWVIRNGPQIGWFSGMLFDSAHLVFSPWVGIFCRVCKDAAAPVINQVEVRNWCWFNARPTSLTLSRHWPSNGLALYHGRFCRCPVFFCGRLHPLKQTGNTQSIDFHGVYLSVLCRNNFSIATPHAQTLTHCWRNVCDISPTYIIARLVCCIVSRESRILNL